MALQTKTISFGSFDRYQGTTNGYILDLIITEESTDVLENVSEISYKLQLRSGPSNRFSGVVLAKVFLNGENVAQKEVGITAAYNTTYVLVTGNVTIQHNEDGSLALPVSGTLFPYEYDTNQFSPPIMEATGTVELTAIARASSVAATSVFIGDTSTIVISRKNDSYVHSVQYQFGDLSGYIYDATGNIGADKRITDATVLLFPIREAFYHQIPSAPSGICTLTCTTYSGDVQIGDPQTAEFTVTADPARCGPSVTATIDDINEATLAVTGNSKILVSGKSEASCAISAHARYSAEIAEIYVAGVKTQENPHIISGISTADITVRVVDSRGYGADFSVPGLSIVPYVPISYFATASRTDPTSGNGVLTITGKWYDGSFGKEENSLIAQYSIDNGGWVQFLPDTSGGDIFSDVPLSDLDYRYAHTINVQIQDKLEMICKTAKISKGIPVFDWGENDFCFNVPVIFTATDGSRFSLDLIDGQLQVRRTT